MHLEREDVTLGGDQLENEGTTEGLHYSSGHGMPADGEHSGGHAMMKMYFHTSNGDTYLFKDWVLSADSDIMFACLALFTMAIIYEAIKTFQKVLLAKKFSHSNCYPVASTAAANGDVRGNCHESHHWLKQMFAWYHLLSTLVHVLQVCLGYSLMLAIMTFNVWLCVAVITGAGIGYFLFSWQRSDSNNDSSTESCFLNKSFVGDFNETGFK